MAAKRYFALEILESAELRKHLEGATVCIYKALQNKWCTHDIGVDTDNPDEAAAFSFDSIWEHLCSLPTLPCVEFEVLTWGPGKQPATDTVNHPPHYNAHPSGVECITVVEHMGFNVGNAIKYLWRAGHKGSETQDLEKAAWYISREIERLKSKEAQIAG